MQIIQIIDSLELNGGSTMFLETVSAMQKYFTNDTIIPYVVSKTGHLGRDRLVDTDLASSYGVELTVLSYESFAEISKKINNSVVFHHVLGCTKNIEFNSSCKYFVVNHTMTNIHRLKDFKSTGVISVCKYFDDKLRLATKIRSKVVLNGCEDYSDVVSCIPKSDDFIIGCCQRIVPSKFTTKKRSMPTNCLRYVIGPVDSAILGYYPNYRFIGPIFNKKRKLSYIKGFDAYLHDTSVAEGASMSILESLSCGTPVIAKDVGGGTNELIIDGVNGFMFKSQKGLTKIIKLLAKDRKFLSKIKEKTREDFMNRLHIKHTLNKYRKLFF